MLLQVGPASLGARAVAVWTIGLLVFYRVGRKRAAAVTPAHQYQTAAAAAGMGGQKRGRERHAELGYIRRSGKKPVCDPAVMVASAVTALMTTMIAAAMIAVSAGIAVTGHVVPSPLDCRISKSDIL